VNSARRPPSEQTARCLIRTRDRVGPFAFFATADVAAFPTQGEEDSLTFEVVEALPSMSNRSEEDPAIWTRGEAQSVLAPLLGHREDDIRLLYPQSA
jgi:hypothetical protein